MIKQQFQIEKMPFFERFEERGKAVIHTEIFERWFRETFSSESKKQQDIKQGIHQENNNKITETLNKLYETEPSSTDPVLMKMQLSSIEGKGW